MTVLTIDKVTYSYKGKGQTKNVLKEASSKFEKGKIYAIVGQSGAGKTTLLSLMAGLDNPQSGDIYYHDTALRNLNRDKYRSENIGVVFQAFHLIPYLTVSENITLVMELANISKEEAKKRVPDLLKKVGLKTEYANKRPLQLSGGEQQRVAIARAISTNAEIILADEPTGNLDDDNSQNVVDIFKKLAYEDNKCVIIITHSKEISKQADKTYRIEDGKLKEEYNIIIEFPESF